MSEPWQWALETMWILTSAAMRKINQRARIWPEAFLYSSSTYIHATSTLKTVHMRRLAI